MELNLKGKNVIVTGGGSNIGRATVLSMASLGANVAIAEISEQAGNRVADEAKGVGIGKIVPISTDVTDLNSVHRMSDTVMKEFDCIDVLINNVGWITPMFFLDTAPEIWDKTIAVNYRGVLNCVSAILPHMVERKSGVIVNLSSDAGRVGEAMQAVYSGCKAAVIAFTKAMAKEVGRSGVRLNVVCPGVTPPSPEEEVSEASLWKEPKIVEAFSPETLEKIKGAYPLRRLGTAQEMADAVVFLASDASKYITGQTLSVSGGYSMM